MKTFLVRISQWLSLSLIMYILWIVGMMAGEKLFPAEIESNADESTAAMFLLVICMLNTTAILIFVLNSFVRKWRLAVILFIIIFGLQFFLSQVETIWFNDSLKMSGNLIAMVVFSGFFMSIWFSILATWISGRFKGLDHTSQFVISDRKQLWSRMAVLAALVWPLVYFAAGYLIAWQFAEVRQYYSGSEQMESLWDIMVGNITSGLYFFQIPRGFVWIGIAFLILISIEGSTMKKGLIVGMLFTVISCSPLLLPNPIMPPVVREAHLIETSISNFIWGYIIVYALNPLLVPKKELGLG